MSPRSVLSPSLQARADLTGRLPVTLALSGTIGLATPWSKVSPNASLTQSQCSINGLVSKLSLRKPFRNNNNGKSEPRKSEPCNVGEGLILEEVLGKIKSRR
jgi:hypothetical protein